MAGNRVVRLLGAALLCMLVAGCGARGSSGAAPSTNVNPETGSTGSGSGK